MSKNKGTFLSSEGESAFGGKSPKWEALTMAAAVVIVIFLAIYGEPFDFARDKPGRTIAQGRQTYFVFSKEKGPKVTEVVIDPFDPRRGERQTMSVKVNYPEPVRSVAVTMKLDGGDYTYPLTLVSGTDRDGTWEGSWRAEDTHDVIYKAAVVAEGPDDGERGRTTTIWLTLR